MVHTNSKRLVFGAVFSLSLLVGSIQASDLKHKVALYAGAASLASTTEALVTRAINGKFSGDRCPVAGFDVGRSVPVSAHPESFKDSEGKEVMVSVVDASESRYDLRAGYFSVGISIPGKGSLAAKILNTHPHAEGFTVKNVVKTVAASYALKLLLPLAAARLGSSRK